MAKMFYSLEEAAAKLGMSEGEVQGLAASGQLQEFRDPGSDKMMFKVEQVDLLAHEGEEPSDMSSMIPLVDTGAEDAIKLGESGSAAGMESPKEQTGVSIFEIEDTEEADPSAVTQVTGSAPTELTLESIGSGSGLLDLTREADDTSLGAAGLLEEIYSGEEGETAEGTGAGAEPTELFESTEAESDVTPAPAPMAAIAAEPYDGAGSGWTGGMSLAMALSLAFALSITLMGMLGTGSGMLAFLGNPAMGDFPMWMAITAGMAIAIIIFALIGWMFGKKT